MIFPSVPLAGLVIDQAEPRLEGIEMGLADGTVGAELVKARDARGDAPFLMFADDTYSYADAEERSARAAAGLRSLGVARGDHVALIMPNTPEFLWAWFGAARLGAPVVPVNTALKGDGLVHILDHSDSETVVVHADLLDRFTDVRGRLAKVRRAVVVAATPRARRFRTRRGTT